MDFHEALERFGFSRSQERGFARNAELYVRSPNRFMTYSVHAYPDGTALFSWEFAIADYLSERGLQVGTAESDNQLMYPRFDVRGPQDGTWLTAAIEQTEAVLGSIRLDDPDR